jgi:hypothetical protein
MDFRYLLILIVGMFMLITIGGLIAQVWPGQWQLFAARAWSATTGWVVAANVRQKLVRVRGAGLSYRMATSFSAQIVYRYEVHGVTYENDRVAFGQVVGASGTGWAEKQVDRYPVGSQITVYYDPNDPANSVLKRGFSWSVAILWMVIIVLLLVLGAIVVMILSSPPIMP